MKTVNEVSKISGVSIRALHYYDAKGLLHPAKVTEAGYRMYDDEQLRRLQLIMLFKELDFPLEDIKQILDNPAFDANVALQQQIELLKLKKERIDRMIVFAEQIKTIGVKEMDFSVFDDKKQKEYAKKAKEKWGNTEAYREYEAKTAANGEDRNKWMAIMSYFAEFGKLLGKEPGDAQVQDVAKRLRDYISENFYTCTLQIFAGLGQMYSAGGEMTDNIEKAGGKGTAKLASDAISFYCKSAVK